MVDCEWDSIGDGASRPLRKFSCAVVERQTTAIAGVGTGEGKRALQSRDHGSPVMVEMMHAKQRGSHGRNMKE